MLFSLVRLHASVRTAFRTGKTRNDQRFTTDLTWTFFIGPTPLNAFVYRGAPRSAMLARRGCGGERVGFPQKHRRAAARRGNKSVVSAGVLTQPYQSNQPKNSAMRADEEIPASINVGARQTPAF